MKKLDTNIGSYVSPSSSVIEIIIEGAILNESFSAGVGFEFEESGDMLDDERYEI